MLRPLPTILTSLAFAGVIACALACSHRETRQETAAEGQTAFPAQYRAWKKVGGPIVREAEKEVRDLYANEVAVHRSGSSFPVGSILVKEERVLNADPSGSLKPGDLSRISVMFKVGGGSTSGWSFKAFDPATHKELPRDRVDPDGCYFCHADGKDNDYVFTTKM